jgi:hypothetical protein
LDSYSAGSLKQQSTGRYDDVLFVLDKHAELDSYSAGTLKQQSTGRYDDGAVSQHYKNPTQRVCLVQSGHNHIYQWTVVSLSQHYKNPTQHVWVALY